MSSAASSRIHHIDVVVRDLDRAEDRYRTILGVDPLPRERLPDREIELVRFRVGETWLILVRPTSTEGPVAAFLDEHGEGFFHVAIAVDDVVERARILADEGIELVNREPRIGVDGWKLVDLGICQTMGAMIQLIEEPGPP
jgi:methylmalonyl-CoA/ethylmalonyl-CoA epimerase